MSEEFVEELRELLNRHSIEQVADVPDFILAEMICTFLLIGPLIKKTLDWHGCSSVCHPGPQSELSAGPGDVIDTIP